jgi:hypothetical protein
MPHEPCLKTLCDDSWTEDDLQTRFYGLVWDSTWLPAVVVQHAPMGCALVRLDHGVTFNVTMADLLPRDPARCGGDVPSATRVTRP